MCRSLFICVGLFGQMCCTGVEVVSLFGRSCGVWHVVGLFGMSCGWSLWYVMWLVSLVCHVVGLFSYMQVSFDAFVVLEQR